MEGEISLLQMRGCALFVVPPPFFKIDVSRDAPRRHRFRVSPAGSVRSDPSIWLVRDL